MGGTDTNGPHSGPYAVFLDRDNTLIVNDGDLGDPGLVVLVPEAPSSLVRLRGAGLRLVVASNQGGVARGAFTVADVEAVNRRIDELLEQSAGVTLIERFYYCPYHPEGTVKRYRREHPWRKPQPGMLLQAAADLGLDLAASWMVGDSVRDVEAGRAAGCRTILISRDPSRIKEAAPTAHARSLSEAADIILDTGAA